MIICDTNILISYLARLPNTVYEMQRIGQTAIALPTVVILELYRGMQSKRELRAMQQVVGRYKRLPITEQISDASVELMLQFNLSHGLQIPDALIAATAVTYQLPLFTYNLKDFRFIPGLVLHTPASI